MLRDAAAAATSAATAAASAVADAATTAAKATVTAGSKTLLSVEPYMALVTTARKAVSAAVAAAPVIAPDGKIPTNEELLDFFRKRVDDPGHYTFDPKGNLVVKERIAAKGKDKTPKLLGIVDGVPSSVRRVYTIPPYRPYTAEERDEMESLRTDAVRAAEEKYDNALDKLRQVYGKYKSGEDETRAEEVINANKEVEKADSERHAAMYAVRSVYSKGTASITTVFPKDVFDKDRTFASNPLRLMRRSTYPLEQIYVTAGEEIMPVAEPAATAGAGAGGQGRQGGGGSPGFAETLAKDLSIILFGQPTENEYGFLSTFYPVEFVIDNIKYFTIEQYLAAEKARLFLDDALRTRIMKTRAPRSMRTMANGILMKPAAQTGGVHQIQMHEWDGPVRESVLQKATLAKFRQHPELRDKLLMTGGAVLALADTREKRDGIGLALSDTAATQTTNWRGSNLYGRILMKVREQLREEYSTDTVTGGAAGTEEIHGGTISSTDYRAAIESARKGAIIGHSMARRNH